LRHFPAWALFVVANVGAATVQTDYAHDRWSAKWIRVPGSDPAAYGVYHFRRDFTSEHGAQHVRVFVSADNRYQLFLNGELIAVGPARSDLFHWRYETVDVGSRLRTGANVLAAVVWNDGPHRAIAQNSSGTGFLLQAEDPAFFLLNSSKSWLCVTDRAYSPQPISAPDLVQYTALGPNERFDATAYPWGWQADGFDDRSWSAAEELSQGSPRLGRDGPNAWMLTPAPIPPEERRMSRLDRLRSANGVTPPAAFPRDAAPFTIAPNTHATLLLDQSFLTTAYPELIVSGGKNSTVHLRYAESLYDRTKPHLEKGNRNEVQGKTFLGRFDTYLPDGGEKRIYRPLYWRTYRYLELDIQTANEPLTVEDIRGIFTAYPFARTASIKLSDPDLDARVQQILSTGWRTARLCAHETYMDCPYYEQLQYAGDARIQMLVSLYNSGDARLMRNGIEEINASRTSEGATYSRAPSALPQYIPPFSLWWIGMVHDYWMYVDDPDFVRAMLPGVESILRFFAAYQKPNGSLGHLPWWNFVDWTASWNAGVPPANEDGSSSAAIDLQLVLAYQWAADLERGLGDISSASRYATAAETLKNTVRLTDWDSARRIFADQPEHRTYSQQVNTLAVLAGVLPAKDARDVLLRALDDPTLEHSSIYFLAYTNEALARVGDGGTYLQRLGPWLHMLQQGLTTWSEIDTPETRSDCHAWGASPNIEIFRTVVGITSAKPGYAAVRIAPNLGTLTALHAVVPHPKGRIDVQIDVAARTAAIRLPEGVPGEFIWKGRAHVLRPGENEITLPLR
jgi:hypothetical protein